MLVFTIINHQTSLPSNEFITNLMQRRVRQGYPEEITIKIDDQPQTAYAWTDGINYIRSIFLLKKQDTIKEIALIGKP